MLSKLKPIWLLYGFKFGQTNNMIFTSRPISARLFFFTTFSSDFLQNFLEESFVIKTDNCFGWIARVMTCFSIRFIIFNVYFPKNFKTFILQLPLFHSRCNFINNYVTSPAILSHFSIISELSNKIWIVLILFVKLILCCEAWLTSFFILRRLALIATIFSLRNSMVLLNLSFLTMLL